MKWKIVYTKQAQKDAKKIAVAGLNNCVLRLIKILQKDPFPNSPPYEKWLGDLKGAYSRHINFQYRLVYQVLTDLRIVEAIHKLTYYE